MYMKKIITALEENEIREELKIKLGIHAIQFVGNNIVYPEGIIELLEKEEKVDTLLLQDTITNKKEIIPLLEKIKQKKPNIKMILILEKKEEMLLIYLKQNAISYYFAKDSALLRKLQEELQEKQEDSQIELKKEIQDLKQLLLQKNQKNLFSMLQPLKGKIGDKTKTIPEKKRHIIGIIGPSGVGKSVITVNLANSLQKEYSRILVLDFDFLNNSLHTIYGVKKYPSKIEQRLQNNVIPIFSEKNASQRIKKLAIPITKKIDLISGLDILFQKEKNKIASKIQEMLVGLQKEYEMIIVDTSCECFFDIHKAMLECSDTNIFVTDTNILGIKKAKRLLDIYLQQWKIEPNKIGILFNKVDAFSIEEGILKNIFSDFRILGKIKYQKRYNLFINTNAKNQSAEINLKKPYTKITKRILKIETPEKENFFTALRKKLKEA